MLLREQHIRNELTLQRRLAAGRRAASAAMAARRQVLPVAPAPLADREAA